MGGNLVSDPWCPRGLRVVGYLPLRSISHREDELGTYQEYTSETENGEYDQTYTMAERVEFGVGKRAGHEVEGEVEVRLLPSVFHHLRRCCLDTNKRKVRKG